jgi:hypothetical protein
MAIQSITKKQLKESFATRMLALAARHGLAVTFSKHDEFEAYFWEEGAKNHTAHICVDFEYVRYYHREPDNPKVNTFVVSGKFLPTKQNSARGARSPWSSNYVKTKDYDKAVEALESTTRRDNPKERIERAAFEAKARWNCNEWERRYPGFSKCEAFCVAEALDGRMPATPEGNDAIDNHWLQKEIEDKIAQRNRYIEAWMKLEIIDISMKHELAALGCEA